MIKKKMTTGKHQAWNKGLKVGKRQPFSPSDVSSIRKLLAKRGDAGLRDLALFSTAMDTMLRASDLVGLTVQDVRKRNRVMRETFEVEISTSGKSVQCILSKRTISLLEKWINQTGKKPRDYLFTRRTGDKSAAMSTRQVSRLVKTCAGDIGLDPDSFGTGSLRRTRATHLLNRTGNVEAIRILLGLTSIGATAQYLGDSMVVDDALEVSRAYLI